MLSLCARIPFREDGLRKSTCSFYLVRNRSQRVGEHGFLEESQKQEREIEEEEKKEAEEDCTYM
jgi:hypothetical protein